MLSQLDDNTRPATMAGLFELAPAKINLALHVVGRRADGYHLLESIVTFADHGDRLDFAPAERDRFSFSGRFAPALSTGSGKHADNLVLKARDRLRSLLQDQGLAAPPVAIHLEKNLPVAAGIGGGSADAAAALRGLLRLWDVEVSAPELDRLALELGADVPMCLRSEPMLVRGIGEDVTLLPDFPSLALVLANPLVGVSTPQIFRRLERKNNPPIGPKGEGDWVDFLGMLRNDLEPPARSLVPEIAQVSAMLDAEDALLTRMTGSGATCFGLFETMDTARGAASALQRRKPDWYFQAVQTAGHKSGTSS
ncbi:4-(cytidine 5'-diphospho)-2-C-methyl-D-erythritol kinase [Neorhizobium lilium]|uniref:4-diphosphocytidyl-2-C-methyl-D-erythritol kinase n=1 Tax=Neorhizobium lilium TaxID=2503024 RepID=A0A444LG46_9HYPH|nr:4-(cytidine 5'-diphospho)-2-C-methyl-D-erythritol kinase [Neorhizobium lilium]RWX77158.1 4-(cytidine 5'-diphospho)-2-C-methyl-D-erythritol kinase [Neorhizobium lilium]